MRRSPEEIQNAILNLLKSGDMTAKQLAKKLGFKSVSDMGPGNLGVLRKSGRITFYIKNGVRTYTLPVIDTTYNPNKYIDKRHKFMEVGSKLAKDKKDKGVIKPISYHAMMGRLENIKDLLGGDFYIDEISADIIKNISSKINIEKRLRGLIYEVLRYANVNNICIHSSIIQELNNNNKRQSKQPKLRQCEESKPKIYKWWQRFLLYLGLWSHGGAGKRQGDLNVQQQ